MSLHDEVADMSFRGQFKKNSPQTGFYQQMKVIGYQGPGINGCFSFAEDIFESSKILRFSIPLTIMWCSAPGASMRALRDICFF
jgi:hypothetical protein